MLSSLRDELEFTRYPTTCYPTTPVRFSKWCVRIPNGAAMLNEELKQQLVDAAIEARKNAYAPYSKFGVGAALVTTDGEFFRGCNIENASFGLTICAERVAIGNAITAGKRNFEAICVVSEGGASPCGACRQFLNEFGRNTIILLVDADSCEIRKETTIHDLLPHSFEF